MDDDPLVVRLRAGDEAAFDLLVRDHGPWLRRLAAELVHNEAVAEEVVQDTWLAVYLGIDRFEGKSSLRTWITHILQNRARSARSREQRCTAVCGEDLDRLADTTSLWTTGPTSCTDDVDARVTADQLVRTVRRVLPRLHDLDVVDDRAFAEKQREAMT